MSQPAFATLFGIVNPGDGGRQLITLNTSTGDTTFVGSSHPVTSSTSGPDALDTANNRYFFVANISGVQRLLIIDTQTGALLGSPAISGNPIVLAVVCCYRE